MTDAKALRKTNVAYWLQYDRLPADAMVTSHSFQPSTLLIYRLVAAVYCAAVLLVDLFGKTHKTPLKWPFYLTHLSLLALTLYFWVMSWKTYVFRRDPTRYRSRHVSCQRTRTWRSVAWVAYSTVCCWHILVPIIYWSFLSGRQLAPLQRWVDISVHGVTSVLLCIDVAMTCVPIPFRHGAFVAVFGVVYIGWMLLATMLFVDDKGRPLYVYKIFRPGKDLTFIGLYAATTVLYFASFFSVWWIHRWKLAWAKHKGSTHMEQERTHDLKVSETIVDMQVNQEKGTDH